MSVILEADETGALHLPANLLPHPGPHRRYRVAAEGDQVVVNELQDEVKKPVGFVQKWAGTATKATCPDDQELKRINEKHLR